jgi:hypothetical protein
MQNQPTFEDLISCTFCDVSQGIASANSSPYLFEQQRNYLDSGHGCSNPSMKSAGSIDEFLADYRHDDVSILAFISCLGEQDTEPTGLSSLECIFTQNPPSSEKKLLSSKIGKEQKLKNLTSIGRLEISKNKSCKSLRPRTNIEAQEEIRRSKNREYQRRFREKKMRLEFQRLCGSAKSTSTQSHRY